MKKADNSGLTHNKTQSKVQLVIWKLINGVICI